MDGLAFQGVGKRFGDVVAVDDFSLDVADGEFVALVGPSGCGKTTSLRIIAGLETATSGRVLVNGRDVSELPSRDRNLAMVFQSYALYPHMTAAENIGFSLSLTRIAKDEVERRTRLAAERLGIGHLLHRRPKELSGGQRQRVAVARCIVREPAAFLFDEPLSNLDAKLRGAARVEIVKLQKSLGVTTLYVTHDQVEAMTMADRIVLMDAGRIRQLGTPMELYHQPIDLFVAGFLGSPPMNLLSGRLRTGHLGREFVASDLVVPLPDVAAPDGPVTLGIRPEDLQIASGGSGSGLAVCGVVSHVEHLGAETLVEFSAGKAGTERMIARLAGTRPVETQDPIEVRAGLASLRLFGGDGAAIPLHGTAQTKNAQTAQSPPGRPRAA